ncbi:hypothetical protein RND71_011859 [Anisodus tanguticus]|uniref:Epoxide hydrolase n=1 Tax=Anisodus tanguticus TaxID=243964 RepID=A0AAE1SEA3_9SOLA|nr:hypothetical protein RND71_011859 [Anisodus tanguticus]
MSTFYTTARTEWFSCTGKKSEINRRNLAVNRIAASGMTPSVVAESSQGFGWSEKARIDYDALIWRDQIVDFLKEIVKQPAVLVENRLAFWLTMRPDHIEGQLKSGVYKNYSNVDDYLINSIVRPAAYPYAWEVYHRLLKQLMSNPTKYTLDSVLRQLSCPLLLLWGDLDPLVHDHAKPNRIKEFYPNTSLVNLQAGHYPQDEVPEQVNKALLDWLSTLEI